VIWSGSIDRRRPEGGTGSLGFGFELAIVEWISVYVGAALVIAGIAAFIEAHSHRPMPGEWRFASSGLYCCASAPGRSLSLAACSSSSA
jgi:hypothetical protein